METLLLTGATGFVGRNILLSEIRAGNRVLAPVRNAEKLRLQLEAEAIPLGNVTALDPDPATWGAILPDRALLSAGVLFARDREDYFRVNVDWTLRVLQTLPVSCNVVVLSSQSAGGPTPHDRQARTESDHDAPLTWYGKSKLALERAIARDFPSHRPTILRPPMILGARDTATLPLFKMAAGLLRPKPGLRPKEYSFIAVEDVVQAVSAAWQARGPGPYYIASDQTITDIELINTAAQAAQGHGITLPLPQIFIKILSLLVDAIPALRTSAPSLTRDRVREIWPDRWVVDSSAFRKASGWSSRTSLHQALHSAYESFVREGLLPRHG
ncbi:MAG: NAD-dependent epimerase/dehydratase family protein [Terrimicrobiaceae bacterium]